MFAGSATSVFSRPSVNSSNHSRRSPNWSSEAWLLSSFFFLGGDHRVGLPALDNKFRHFVNWLDSEVYLTSPAVAM